MSEEVLPEGIMKFANDMVAKGQINAAKKQLMIKSNTVTHQLEGFVKIRTGDRIVVRTSGINRELVIAEFKKMTEEVKK